MPMTSGSKATQQNSERVNWERLQEEYGSRYSAQTFREFHQKYLGKLTPADKPTTYEDLEACFRDYVGLSTSGWNR